jgi:hypothetical protein
MDLKMTTENNNSTHVDPKFSNFCDMPNTRSGQIAYIENVSRLLSFLFLPLPIILLILYYALLAFITGILLFLEKLIELFRFTMKHGSPYASHIIKSLMLMMCKPTDETLQWARKSFWKHEFQISVLKDQGIKTHKFSLNTLPFFIHDMCIRLLVRDVWRP